MADLSIIYSKTGKGLRARKATAVDLSSAQLMLLTHIDGKTTVDSILSQNNSLTEKQLFSALIRLETTGYIRPLVSTNREDDWALTSNFTPMQVEEFISEEALEAQASAKLADEKKTAERIAHEKDQEKSRWKAEITARKNAEKQRVLLLNEQEAKAKESAAAILKIESEKKAEQTRLQAEHQAEEEQKSKAATQARLEAERKARAENDLQLEALRKSKLNQKAQQAAEQARLEIANIVRKAEEARKQVEAAAKEARLEAKRQVKAQELTRIKADSMAAQQAAQALLDAEIAAKNKTALQQAAQLETERIAAEAEASRLHAQAEAHKQAEQIKQEQARQLAESAKLAADEHNEALRLAQQEQANQIRAIADAEEQAMLDDKKVAQQEMARIAREADVLRAQDRYQTTTEPTLNKPITNKQALTSPTITQFEKSRFGRSKLEKTKLGKNKIDKIKPTRTNSTEKNDFEDTYDTQQNQTVTQNTIAKNVQVKAKNAAIIAARDAKNRAGRTGRWVNFLEKLSTKPKNYAPGLQFSHWITKPLKIIFIYAPLLAIICIGALHFINISPLIVPIEKIASDSLGKPMHIQQVRASLWPQPHIVLGDVTIGDSFKATTIQLTPDISALLDDLKSVQLLEMNGLIIEQNNVDEALQLVEKLGHTQSLKVDQLSVNDLRFKLNDLLLEPLHGKLVLNEAHALDYLDLQNLSNTLNVQIKPQNLKQNMQYELTLSATNWPLPLNPNIIFSALKSQAVISQNQMVFSAVNGALFGGNISGKATLDWASGWKTAGDFSLTNANTNQLTGAFGSSVKVDGKANLLGNFSAQASNVNALIMAPIFNVNLDLNNGKINGIDLVQALISSNHSLVGDATVFDKLTAHLQIKNGQYQYKQIALTTKQFRASGDITIDNNQDVTGRVSANLVAQSRRLQGSFGLGGKVNNLKRQ